MSPAGGNGAGEPALPPPVLQVAFWGPPISSQPPPSTPVLSPGPHSSQPAGSLQGTDNPHASRGLCLLRPHSPALWLCLLESPVWLLQARRLEITPFPHRVPCRQGVGR